MVHFRQIHDARSRSFTYLLADGERRDAILIDPVAAEVTLYLALLDEIQARLSHILLTHLHGEAGAGIGELRKATAATLIVGDRCRCDAYQTATRVGDGGIVVFGDEFVRCRATPGHTAGCMSYLWRDRVFSGDALPVEPGHDAEAADEDPGALFDSLTRKLLTLPDETLVYPGHDYAGRRVSCIGEERDSNPALTGATRDEFIAKHRPTAPDALRR